MVVLACAIFVIASPAVRAENERCYTTFYQTKNAACLDALIESIPSLKPNPIDPSDHANAEAIVGFLAVIFSDLPHERERVLHKEAIGAAKSLYVESFYRSGLLDDAKAYADTNDLSDVFRRYQNQNLANNSASSDQIPIHR